MLISSRCTHALSSVLCLHQNALAAGNATPCLCLSLHVCFTDVMNSFPTQKKKKKKKKPCLLLLDMMSALQWLFMQHLHLACRKLQLWQHCAVEVQPLDVLPGCLIWHMFLAQSCWCCRMKRWISSLCCMCALMSLRKQSRLSKPLSCMMEMCASAVH